MSDETRIVGAAPEAHGRQTAEPKAGAISPGDMVLNSYIIQSEIARGGMGALFEGRHDITGERVAIKAVLDDYAMDARARKLFEREAIALSKVQHEAIVRYRDILRDDQKRLFIIMDFIDGEPMTSFVRSGHLPAEGVELLGARLSAGLAAAHDAGVAHRDIAPKNILLPGGDITKAIIIDFGIAKSLGSGDETLIGDTFAGTIRYAAPEQLGLFGGKVDQRADIYSLGLVLAQAAGVKLDLGGSIGDAVVRRQKNVELPGDLNPELKRKIERMLRADPADRPISMTAAWSDETVVEAQSPQLVQDDISEPAPTASPVAAPAKRPSGGRGGLIAVLLLLLIASGGVFYLTGGADALLTGPEDVVRDETATPRQKLDAASALIAKGGKDDVILASNAFRALSLAGVGEATARLGEMYDPNLFSAATSPFSEADISKAKRYYQRAIRQGYSAAETRLKALPAQ